MDLKPMEEGRERGTGVEEEREGEVVRFDREAGHLEVEVERGEGEGGELGESTNGMVEEGEIGAVDGGEDEVGGEREGEGSIERDEGGSQGDVSVEIGAEDVGVGLFERREGGASLFEEEGGSIYLVVLVMSDSRCCFLHSNERLVGRMVHVSSMKINFRKEKKLKGNDITAYETMVKNEMDRFFG